MAIIRGNADGKTRPRATTLPLWDQTLPGDDHTSSTTTNVTNHPDTSKSSLVVSWDGPQDVENPRNWSNRRRWTVTITVSFFTFISPVASSILSPSLSSRGSILENMTLSIFVLAYAIGPLFWGPFSELCGRLLVLQVSNIWFLVCNTLCGFAKTPTQLLVFRFLAGFGGAAPQSVGGAIVGDMWNPSERGMAMSLYSIAPLVGPSTGPLVGGWIAQKSRWQWVFWSVSIADAILQLAAFVCGFLLPGKYFCVKRTRRNCSNARLVRFVSGPGNPYARSAFEDANHTWTNVMGRGMVKPLVFLATEPVVQVFALYMAVLYGVLYLTLTTFVKVFTLQYNEGTGIAGIHYLAIALGSTVGGQLGARVLTRVYLHLKAKNGGIGVPEMRLPLLMVSATTLPIGLLIYGWSVQAHAFWIVPDLGVFIYSIGIGANWTCIQTYLVDCYAIHAASAIAGVSSFRAFAGFGFPLFADRMYSQLGDGWGNSILALICLVIGCPAPFIFYRYGAQLRARSKGSSVEQ
ncbi:MFS general substrate transporter [Mycena leptocephala]|nr:MFS general substrate transporter [Mycena leptocephala]